MKESIGGTSLFFIVIVILSVFALYVSVAINWSAAYKVKDEILFYIEKNKGLNKKTITEIQTYTKKNGYGATGSCPDVNKECWRAISVNTSDGKAINNNATNFCVKKTYYRYSKDIPETAYYTVKVFFKIEVPIVNRINITIDGETAPIYHTKDSWMNYSKDKCSVVN